MPKATVNEDHNALRWYDHVWSTWKIAAMNLVANAYRTQYPSDNAFRPGVLGPNKGHPR